MTAENLSYASLIGAVKNTLKSKENLEKEVANYRSKLIESQTLYVQMLNAQKILATLSDRNTQTVLDFITGVINKTLAEIFPTDPHSVKISRKLFAGSKPHVTIEILDSKGHVLDSGTQNGTGLNQVISFMYVLTSIEVRKSRKLVLLDEKLNGLHPMAKRLISKIMLMFTEGGYQFIMVEYSLSNIGKIYNVEKRSTLEGSESILVSVKDGYDDNMIFTGDVDLDLLDDSYSEEG